MSDLVKRISIRMLIEINKRMGICVDREVELSAENEIKESIKELVYKILLNDGESSEKTSSVHEC